MITDRIESMYNHTGEAYAMVEEKGGTLARLPKEYQEVEYIESDGNQYIDTGIKPTNNTRTILNFQSVSFLSWAGIFGTYGGVKGSNKFYFFSFHENNNFASYFGSEQKNGIGANNTNIRNIDFNKNVLKIDDVSYTFDNKTFISEYNMLLFGLTGYNGTPNQSKPSIKLFYSKIYENDVIIRNYVPCYRKSDGEVGLYDLVSNTFFTNQGTGAFTYGTEIPKYLDKNLENLSQAISTIDTHTEELEDMRAEMKKPTLNVFSNVMSETAYSEYVNALKDYSSAFYQYMNYNSNEVSGTSEVKLENALSTNALNLSIKGNDEQQSFKGSQLLNIEDINTTTKNGLTYSIKDGIITIDGTATSEVVIGVASVLDLDSSEYYSENLVGYNSSYVNIALHMYRGGKWSNFTQQNYNNNVKGITTTGYNSYYFNFVVAPSSRTYNNEKFMLMFVKGTEKPTEYEPYTGGIPAPNPSYPQEIKTLKEGKVLIQQNVWREPNKIYTTNPLTGSTYVNLITIYPTIINRKLELGKKYVIQIRAKLQSGELLRVEGANLMDSVNNGLLGERKTFLRPTITNEYQIYAFGGTCISDVNIAKLYLQGYNGTNAVVNIKDIIIYEGDSVIEPKEVELPLKGKNLYDGELRQGSWNSLTSSNRLFNKNDLFIKANYRYKIETNLDLTNFTYAIFVNDQPYPVSSMNTTINTGWLNNNSIEFISTKDGYFGLSLARFDKTSDLIPEQVRDFEFKLIQDGELTIDDTINIDYFGNSFAIRKWNRVIVDGVINKLKLYGKYGEDSANLFSFYLPNGSLSSSTGNVKTNLYTTFSGNSLKMPSLNCRKGSGNANFYVRDDRFETLADFNNWLVTNPLVIYYEMATPQTIELENTQIPLLPDTNNISVESNVEPSELKVKYAIDIFSEQPQVLSEVADDE